MNRLTTISLAASAASVALVLAASPASAHTGNLTGTASCVDNGWTVTWTAHNTEAGQSMTPDTPGFTPSPIAAGADGTLRLSFPALQSSVTIAGYFRWPDSYTDPYSVTVQAPTGCTTTTTTTVPATTVPPTTVATSTTVAPTSSTIPPATSSRFTAPPASAPTLPETGASSAPLAAGGVALIGLGAGLVTFARKRIGA